MAEGHVKAASRTEPEDGDWDGQRDGRTKGGHQEFSGLRVMDVSRCF